MAQTYPCRHIMVADGFPRDAIDAWNVEHVRLEHTHADYGDTPRAAGGERAQAIAKFLVTPEGQRLYEEGGATHGLGYDPRLPVNDEDEVVKRGPISKRDAAWERIKAKAEVIQKRGMGCNFAKAVDRVLRDNPELYDEYVGKT